MIFFRKLIYSLTKILKSKPRAQAAIEYFIILSIVTGLIIVMIINFNNPDENPFRQAGEEFFQKAVNGILGE